MVTPPLPLGRWAGAKPICRLPAGLYLGQWFQLIHKFFKCHKINLKIYFLFQWGGNLILTFSNVWRLAALYKNIHSVVSQRKRNAHWCHLLQGCSSPSGVYSWKKKCDSTYLIFWINIFTGHPILNLIQKSQCSGNCTQLSFSAVLFENCECSGVFLTQRDSASNL